MEALLAAACAGVSALCFLGALRPPLTPRNQPAWWKLKPLTPECDEVLASMAVAEMRRRGRPVRATVVRMGTAAGRSALWLGVAGVKPAAAEGHAEAIAKAGGCGLDNKEPPPKAVPGRWWISKPEAEEGKDIDNTSHAEMAQQRGAFAERFADHADSKLGIDDALVVSLVAHRNGKECYAQAATTSEDLAWSWADSSSLNTSRADLGLLAKIAAVSGIVGLLLAVMGFGIAFSIGSPAAGVGGLAAFCLGGAALWRTWAKPKRAMAVERWWHLPVPAKSKKMAALPGGHLAGWVNGGTLTAVEAHDSVAPESVTARSGIRLGDDLAGRACYLPDKDRQWGLFVLGDPGTGKTTLLLNALKGDVAARQAGAERSVLWIETKGEGAQRAAAVIRDTGWEPCVVKAAIPEGVKLELIDWNDPNRSASLLTDSMRYAYEADDIREQSAGILNAVFSSVIALPPEGVAEIGFQGRPDVMAASYWLLGGDTQNRAPERTRKIFERYGGPEYARFADYLPPARSKTDSMRMLEPPRNKVQALLACRGLFSGNDRPWTTLERLIGEHHVTVLDLSPIVGSGYTESTAARTAALMMFCVWDAIKRACDSWQAAGKSVSIYSDELCDIAGFGAPDLEVVRALADQGRSRGVLPVFATQRPGQIPPRTREAVTSFGSHAYFRLKNLAVAEEASRDLREAYSVDEVMSLAVGKCAARLCRDGIPQPAFVLAPDNL